MQIIYSHEGINSSFILSYVDRAFSSLFMECDCSKTLEMTKRSVLTQDQNTHKTLRVSACFLT